MFTHNSNTCTIHVIHDGTVHSSEQCVQQNFYDIKNYNMQSKLMRKQYWNITQINIKKNMNWFIIN